MLCLAYTAIVFCIHIHIHVVISIIYHNYSMRNGPLCFFFVFIISPVVWGFFGRRALALTRVKKLCFTTIINLGRKEGLADGASSFKSCLAARACEPALRGVAI
jgi:hypothetical protein